MLTAIVFAFWPEEENYIDLCLKSVIWADEIIIIDNGANAKTLDKCRQYTNKIFSSNLNSFADRHNLAKDKAKGDWLLYLDADERISVSLQEEIKTTLQNPQYAAYELRRINFFLGKKVKFGDRFPDEVTRLFNKNKLISWTGEIHESSKVDGNIGKLSSPFYHLTHRNIKTMIEKTLNFSEHEAQLRYKSHHPSIIWWRLLRVFLTEFWTRMFKYQGFRQGTEGWIDGIFQAFSLFIVYVRLWELQRSPSLEDAYKKLDEKIAKGETL